MKRTFIIALAAIIGLGITGCEQSTGGGTNQTPAAADFTVNGLTAAYDGSPKAVSITPKAGKSTGQITVWYEGDDVTYDKSKTAPSAVGNYDVTFDVAAASGFNAKAGLIAGTLSIGGSQQNPGLSTPTAADFTVSGLTAIYDGSPKEVSITPKAGKSTGQITIWYTGTAGTVYPRSNTAPSAAGNYAVTFDVAAADGFNAAAGLIAGTLAIKEAITDPHKIVDFETGWDNNGYGERAVSWGGFGWTVSGVVTTTDANDRRDGEKSIRLRGNEGDNCRVQLDSYLTGIKAIYFDYASYSSHSNGVIVLYTQIMGGGWVKAGEVTAAAWEGALQTARFDINKTNARFKIVREGDLANFTSVNIDNIVITGDSDASFEVSPVDPVADDFIISGLSAIYDGSPKEVSITPKAGKSTGQITVYYGGSTNAPSNGGSYAVTFDVAAAPGFKAVTGLSAGTLIIEQINDPHFIVDFEGSEWNSSSYNARDVTSDGRAWRVTGVVNTDANDRYEGAKSVRFRGNATDNVEESGGHFIQLSDYLSTGIKSISFDYASYSSHANGTLVLEYQLENSNAWVQVGGQIIVPSWVNGGSKMLNAHFDLNVTQSARFRIVKLSVSGSTSVNIDNIIVTYTE